MAVVRRRRKKKIFKALKGQQHGRQNYRNAITCYKRALASRYKDLKIENRRKTTRAIEIIQCYARKIGKNYSSIIGLIRGSGFTRHSFAKLLLHVHREEGQVVPLKNLLR
jgi:ribosomal protein L20